MQNESSFVRLPVEWYMFEALDHDGDDELQGTSTSLRASCLHLPCLHSLSRRSASRLFPAQVSGFRGKPFMRGAPPRIVCRNATQPTRKPRCTPTASRPCAIDFPALTSDRVRRSQPKPHPPSHTDLSSENLLALDTASRPSRPQIAPSCRWRPFSSPSQIKSGMASPRCTQNFVCRPTYPTSFFPRTVTDVRHHGP